MEQTVNLTVASKMAGKSTTTLRRWAKESLVKATKKDNGGWEFDTDSLKQHLAKSSVRHITNKSVIKSEIAEQKGDSELICSLQVSLDRERKINDDLRQENSKLQSELLKLTYEMQAILKKESGNKLSRWIKDVVS